MYPTVNWSTIPNLDVRDTLVLSAIADHVPTDAEVTNGISSNVEGMYFQCNGGDIVYVDKIYTDDKGHKSWSVLIDANNFPVTSRYEFRCWPKLSCGPSKVMQEDDQDAAWRSIFFNIDKNGTQFYDTRYVDIVNGNDSNSGLTRELPKLTIRGAKEAIYSNPASGGQVGGGEIVLMHNGAGHSPGSAVTENFQRVTGNRWLTIRGDDGVRPVFDTMLGGDSNLRIAGIRFVGCDFTGAIVLSNNNSNVNARALLALQDCTYVGSGQHVNTPYSSLIGSTWQRVYVDGFDFSQAQSGFTSSNTFMLKNITMSNIGADAVSNTRSVQNVTVDNIFRGSNTGWHPDLYQFTNAGYVIENVMLWDVQSTNLNSQGIFSDSQADGVSDIISFSATRVKATLSMTESPNWVALSINRKSNELHFADCEFYKTGGTSSGTISTTLGRADHMYVDNCIIGTFTANVSDNVIVRGGSFPVTVVPPT